MFEFEHKRQKVISRTSFSRRLGANALIALALVMVALAVGMTGYMWLGELNMVDAFYNAAMILSGMGPANSLDGHDGAKIFAGIYAIACGLLLFAVAGIVLAPLFHRILHRFHVADDEDDRWGK
jgi:sterol desaturase/sphingolipid hydroxylase (fatty acid hydroxylase superfamily)